MTVQVFSKPTCVQCSATYRMMDKEAIDYAIVDISQDDDAFEKVLSLGYRELPVVQVSEEHHWSGFRPDLIKAL